MIHFKGLIILLLKTVSSLSQLFSMNMDIHNKFRTESHKKITCRFNERLILSLADCKRCMVLDDQLTILPISSKTANVEPQDVSDKFKTFVCLALFFFIKYERLQP